VVVVVAVAVGLVVVGADEAVVVGTVVEGTVVVPVGGVLGCVVVVGLTDGAGPATGGTVVGVEVVGVEVVGVEVVGVAVAGTVAGTVVDGTVGLVVAGGAAGWDDGAGGVTGGSTAVGSVEAGAAGSAVDPVPA
jgi:hypothetical protein